MEIERCGANRWFLIGLHLYIFPPEPKIGDFQALHNWEPRKMGIWDTLKFRWGMGIWRYTVSDVRR